MRDGRPTTWSSWSSLGFELGLEEIQGCGMPEELVEICAPLSFTWVLNTFDIPTAMITFPTKDISGEGDTTGS